MRSTMFISRARRPTSPRIVATKTLCCRSRRLRGAAGTFQRSKTKTLRATAANYWAGRKNRWDDAGGADAADGACQARPAQGGETRLSGQGLDLAADKARALALTPVSRETEKRLRQLRRSAVALAKAAEPRRDVDGSADLDAARRRFAAALAFGGRRNNLGRFRLGWRLPRHCACLRIGGACRDQWSI